MVFVADTNRIPFGLEGLVLELGDEFLHVLHQFLVAYTVAVLLHGELLPIHKGYREYDSEIFGRRIPCILSIADKDTAFLFWFAGIEFVLRVEYVVLAGLFMNRVVPPDPLSFFECLHIFRF